MNRFRILDSILSMTPERDMEKIDRMPRIAVMLLKIAEEIQQLTRDLDGSENKYLKNVSSDYKKLQQGIQKIVSEEFGIPV